MRHEERRSLARSRTSGPRIARPLAIVTMLGLLSGAVALSAPQRSSAATAVPGRASAAKVGPFGWLARMRTPSSWPQMQLPDGTATVSSPPSFTPGPSDPGTVTSAVHDPRGKFLAYLNVTPRQGDEKLRGFPTFRVGLIRDENKSVHEEAAAEGLRFRGAQGSCVIDRYTKKTGTNQYREITCFVMGAHAASVVVAAATIAGWSRFEGLLRQAIASLVVS